MPATISVVGYGRLAKDVVPALHTAGIKIHEWCIRSGHDISHVQDTYNCRVVSAADQLTDGCDIALLAVPDKAIEEVSRSCSHLDAIVCHTSGMTPLSVIKSKNRGVFYPLNTFSGTGEWIRETPIFVRSEITSQTDALLRMARLISTQASVYDHDDYLRTLHLAAVLSQNFSNHLIARAEEILIQQGYDRALIHPLLQRMVANMSVRPAADNQTGPARRQDDNTIDAQRNLLEGDATLLHLYDMLTRNIQNHTFDLKVR